MSSISNIVQDDGTPEQHRVALMARAWAALNERQNSTVREGAEHRIGAAASTHAELLSGRVHTMSFVLPTDAEIWLTGQEPARRRWLTRLAEQFESIREGLIALSKTRELPAHEVSGDAVLLRADCLPLKQDRLNRWVRGNETDGLSDELTQMIVDETLWQCGACLAWEYVCGHERENPFAPLLVIYEEGFIPLAWDEGAFTLLSPE